MRPSPRRQILDGQSQVNGDFAVPPPAILKQALQSNKARPISSPSGGNRYVAMNTTIKPFDNINVRKAVLADSDRDALRLTRGGAVDRRRSRRTSSRRACPASTRPAAKGPDLDFLAEPEGRSAARGRAT